MAISTSSSISRASARRLSFNFLREDSKPVPLHVKIGGGEKCLVTLAQTLFDSLYTHPSFIALYTNAKMAMDPNYYYNYILHITGKKPYDGETVRKTQAKLGFTGQHFTELLRLLGEAAVTLAVNTDVIGELLEVALTTKNDMLGKQLEGSVSFW
jgi:truncated hemoglobin YjbI